MDEDKDQDAELEGRERGRRRGNDPSNKWQMGEMYVCMYELLVHNLRFRDSIRLEFLVLDVSCKNSRIIFGLWS